MYSVQKLHVTCSMQVSVTYVSRRTFCWLNQWRWRWDSMKVDPSKLCPSQNANTAKVLKVSYDVCCIDCWQLVLITRPLKSNVLTIASNFLICSPLIHAMFRWPTSFFRNESIILYKYVYWFDNQRLLTELLSCLNLPMWLLYHLYIKIVRIGKWIILVVCFIWDRII